MPIRAKEYKPWLVLTGIVLGQTYRLFEDCKYKYMTQYDSNSIDYRFELFVIFIQLYLAKCLEYVIQGANFPLSSAYIKDIWLFFFFKSITKQAKYVRNQPITRIRLVY